MTKKTSNTHDKITNAINSITDVLLDYLSKSDDQYPILKYKHLTDIIKKHNRENVLNSLTFNDFQSELRVLINKKNIRNDKLKASFVEDNLFRGIAILHSSSRDNIRLTSPNNNVIMPPLDVDALDYRYNNDKDTYAA